MSMRQDAKVVIRFKQSNLKSSLKSVSSFFANSANQATGAKLERLGDNELAENTTESAAPLIAEKLTPQDQTAWQKNISAWWLMSAMV